MRDLMSGIRFVPYLQKAVGSFVAHHDETRDDDHKNTEKTKKLHSRFTKDKNAPASLFIT